MSKPLTPWTCLRCLRRQQGSFQRRLATTVAAAAITSNPATYRVNSSRPDDSLLRQIFDSKHVWQEFSDSRRGLWGSKNVGLFHNHFLRTPGGFHEFADVSIQKCQRLLDRIVAISTVEEYRKIVQYLDRMSDLLCRIIDVADFVRSTHPDRAFQQAATMAHSRMFEYMNTLNTTTELYDQLNAALGNKEVISVWTEEELRVAQILHKDFSQSAIHLPKDKRAKFVTLSNLINDEGSAFLDDIRPSESIIRVRKENAKGLDPRLVRQYTDSRGSVALPVAEPVVSHVLKEASDESLRREMYIASRTAESKQVEILQMVMKTRAELAVLSGFKSYAEMALKDKMAGSPEAVSRFLDALADDNRRHVTAELSRLQEVRNRPPFSMPGPVTAWDREYYRLRAFRSSGGSKRTLDLLPPFFSLGTVMQGLSRLFTALYGVRLQPVEPLPGETWSPEVRRLDILDEHEGRIAIVYCDLFARNGKSPNPAHFTVRCSRLIPGAEVMESSDPNGPYLNKPLSQDPVALANDGMATSRIHSSSATASTAAADGAYQLPTIALICDFPVPPPGQKSPTLLSTTHLTTLFHEMGHAIHSILGRTTLQNVSGTRCATDFAELPSILMENFATDPAVLSLYARHWETDAPLPEDMARQMQQRAQSVEANGGGGREGAADTEWQIVLSALDQAYHSPLALEGGFDTSPIAHDVYSRYLSVPEPRQTRWEGFFGHLIGYGASYYAYLFDRAIAKRVWEVVFDKGKEGAAVERERGESFKREVLRWGGARDPWRCVAGVLGDEKLEGGGERAMAEVGRWGVSGGDQKGRCGS